MADAVGVAGGEGGEQLPEVFCARRLGQSPVPSVGDELEKVASGQQLEDEMDV